VATFRINIVVNPTAAVAGTRTVERSLTRVENKANRLRRTLGLTFAALAGGAILFGAIRNMAKFSESIAVVRAVTKATADEFEKLELRARTLGITTRFTATQAADAMVLLARAGLSVSETMEAVGDTLLLAQAGGLEMAEAADITASSLRGFGLEAAEVARVTDVLTETANSSNTNVSQLGQALKFVAPIAKGLGQEIEITSAALGALSDAGLKGTLAGTGLRRVLAELASPGRELADILENAGLVAADVDPKVVGLTNALEALKLASFDTGDALEVFGQRGGPAFAVLVDNIPKIRELEKALKASAGEAARVAKIMDETLFGAMKKALSAVEGLNLALGKAGVADVLTRALLGITETFRFLARNAEVLAAIMGAVLVTAALKLSAVLLGKLVPSLVAVGNAAIGSARFLVVLGRAWASLAAIMTTAVPPLLLFATAYAALEVLSRSLRKEFELAEEAFNELAKDAGFARFGMNITLARQELKKLNVVLETQKKRGFGPSESQLARFTKLKQAVVDNTIAARAAAVAERERQEREKRGAAITEATIARLSRRRDVLAALTQQAKDLVAFNQELDRLEQAGAMPAGEEKERIRRLIEENIALAVQQRIFEEIKGPQRKFIENTKALNVLYRKGAIDLAEFTLKMQELKDAMDIPDAVVQISGLEQLQKENDLLARRIELGKEQAAVDQIVASMELAGIGVTSTILDQIILEVAWRKRLKGALKEQTDEARELQRVQQREARLVERVARRINIQERLLELEIALEHARQQGRISIEQQAQALADLQLRGLEASNTLEDGFTRAFAKISREAMDFASVAEEAVNIVASNTIDALSGFLESREAVSRLENEIGSFQRSIVAQEEALAKSGEEATAKQIRAIEDQRRELGRLQDDLDDTKLSFKSFANSILADLQRILLRLLVIQAINALTGGGAGTVAGAAGAIAGGKAEGGTVQPNRSFVVGENGPELFVPDRTGTIVPNQQQTQEAPPVNVQVVNVQSEEDIPNAINAGGSDEAIINVLAREKDRVNQVLS
jgi:TP901 family phage tail tape measure protein